MYIDNSRSWFMNNGQHTGRTARGIQTGSVVGVRLDLKDNSVSFFVDGRPHGGHGDLGAASGGSSVYYPAVSLNRNVQVTLITGLKPSDADVTAAETERTSRNSDNVVISEINSTDESSISCIDDNVINEGTSSSNSP